MVEQEGPQDPAELASHTVEWMRRLDTRFEELKTVVTTEMRGPRDDQTVMIRMLQRREAEIDTMRALEQRYESLRVQVQRLAERVEKLEPAS